MASASSHRRTAATASSCTTRPSRARATSPWTRTRRSSSTSRRAPRARRRRTFGLCDLLTRSAGPGEPDHHKAWSIQALQGPGRLPSGASCLPEMTMGRSRPAPSQLIVKGRPSERRSRTLIAVREGGLDVMDDQLNVPLEDSELLAEVELTTNLIIAATESDHPLPQEVIDRLLAAHPPRASGASIPVQKAPVD